MKNSVTKFLILTAGLLFLLVGIAVIYKKSSNKKMDGFDKYSNRYVQKVIFFAKESKDSSKRFARHGILFRKPGAKATVLMCHGFNCSVHAISPLRSIFKDYNVMSFDFRAHGESTKGQTCTLGREEVNDIVAAVEYIKSDKELAKKPLIAYAFSMGAVAAIVAQSDYPTLFDALILDCPFESTESLLAKTLKNLNISLLGYNFDMPGRTLLKKYAYNRHFQKILRAMFKTISKITFKVNTHILPVDVVAAAKKLTIPALFITCDNDTDAPPESVKKIYEAARGYKRFWITGGEEHFDSYKFNPDKYAYKMRRFIEKFLRGDIKNKVQQKIFYDSNKGEVIKENEIIAGK